MGKEGKERGITGSAGEQLLVVNVALNPGHEMLDVCWGGHFGRSFVVFGVLPEILESFSVSTLVLMEKDGKKLTHR